MTIESGGIAYEIKAIDNFEQVCFITDKDGNRQENPLTRALVHLGQLAGYAGITKQNARGVFERITKLRILMGPLMKDVDGAEYEITGEDVRAHIGLFTNSAPMSAQQFNARVLEMVASQANSFIWKQENRRGE